MNISKILGLSLFTLAVISCKTEEKSPAKEAEPANSYTITINTTVEADDNFQVFYNEDPAKVDFQETKSVRVDVKGANEPQDIVFNLPEDIEPVQLRIDFGSKGQSAYVINKFTLAYNDKKVDIAGADFFNYFRVDEKFAKIEKESGKLIPIALSDGTYDPMIFSEQSLNDKMVNLSK